MSGNNDHLAPQSGRTAAVPSARAGSEGVPETQRRAVAVGLTGGIGAGKSTALSLFAESGALTLSSDQIVHDLYLQPALVARLVERFGPGIIGPDGDVDRGSLGASARSSNEGLRGLEEIAHPLVAAEIEQFVRGAPAGSVVVCEVPLLFEAGLEHLFDLIVTVEAPVEERMRRSAHRTRREDFEEFERLQATTEERVTGSDLVFHNEGDVAALRTFVRSAYARAAALPVGTRP